jgi:hypothetical protein
MLIEGTLLEQKLFEQISLALLNEGKNYIFFLSLNAKVHPLSSTSLSKPCFQNGIITEMIPNVF